MNSSTATYTKSQCSECLGSLQAMLSREEKSYGCCSVSDTDYADVRRSLVDVYDEVFDLCQLQNRDTVSVAISYLDRFMSVQKRFVNVQVAAMTCFYLAVKLYEPTVIPPSMLVEVFSRTLDCDEEQEDDASTDTVVTAEAIETMEMKVLSGLKWNLNPPTAMMFVRQLLCCLPGLSQWKQAAIDLAQAHLRVAVRSNDTMGVRASTQAVAVLFLAVEKLSPAQRAPVYKFLLQAARMTSGGHQRQVLTVQGMIKMLAAEAIQESTPVLPEVVVLKRPATCDDFATPPPAKKQRKMVREVSFTSSPRSTLLLA
ncbi:Cyclin, N-terminal domain [Seminavis robusta]|uniref:Cyclin, N-terminal domain n=1 Tax=Seminavis robusta TaxID=568900 RepID=A0A9N8HVU7_9STRA|nr:Cyclin, N-terminal domain [Seminavis robusta]|eukprot:Sro2055_g312830.1 Cyclin, N-terminal domain (313) ;mRNA; r:13572-14510